MKKLLAFAVFISAILTFSPSNVNAANTNGCSVASESLSSNSVFQNTNFTWVIQANCYRHPYIMNYEQGIGYLCSNGVCLNVTGKSARSSYTYSFTFLVPLNFPIGSATLKMTARGSDYTTIQEINSNFILDVVPVPTTTTTTTTTIPPTTTTTVPLNGCIKSISGQQIHHTVTWFYSQGTPPNNPAYQSISLALWQSMTHEQKINSGPLYMWPAPTGGCNQLYSYPPATTTTTTTTIPPTTTTSTTTTIPPTTTTVASTTTTTTVPRTTITTTTTIVPLVSSSFKPKVNPPTMSPYSIMAQFPVLSNQSLLQLSMQPGCCDSQKIVCIDDKNKEHSWDSVNYPDNSKRYYDIVGIYDIYTTFSIKCLNSNSAGNSSWSPWYTYVGKVKPLVSSQQPSPAIQLPTATLPKVQTPASPAKPQWRYVTKKVLQTVYSNVKTGAVCRDGSSSSATGRGACSWHRGVAKWLTLPPKKVYVNKNYKCYLNTKTNQYTSNCVAV